MASISTIAPHHRTLAAPEQLRQVPAWLIWRYESLAGESKPRKVPYWTDGSRRHGKHGNPKDRARLTSFEAARDAASRRGFDGVGFALLPEWGISALDFDNCIGLGGELPPDIEHVVSTTYAEYSPSGKGIRAFVVGELGNNKSRATETRYGLETFQTSGYVTFTGNVLPATELLGFADTVAPLNERTRRMCRERFAETRSPVADPDDFMAGYEPRLALDLLEMERLLDVLDPDMIRDDWIRVGMALHHETEGDDTGFGLWCDWSSNGVKFPGEEALRDQWDSFTRRAGPGQRQVTMASVIKMANNTATGPVAAEELAERIKEASATQEAATDYEGRFPVVKASSIMARPPLDWLIKGVLPRADLIVIYGSSGAGKSFVALDMAASIAQGVDWRGCRTTKGRTIIIAAEGLAGLGQRLKAYCQYHALNPDELDIGIIAAAPNLLDKTDLTDLVLSIKAAGEVDLVVIDTFAQVTPGANENTGEDMGRALAHARVIREVTGATIMLVHHSGKDKAKGARGWSGIRAALDAELEVVRDELSDRREIRLTKMKDGGEDGLRWSFKLEPLATGMDFDGDVLTSCVVVACEGATREAAKIASENVARRYGPIERHVLEILALVDPAETTIRRDELVTLAVESLPEADPGRRDTRRQLVNRAITTLAKGPDAPISVVGNSVVIYV